VSVLKQMLRELEKFTVLTGYCRIRPNDNRLNITKTPLLGDFPSYIGYNFYTVEDVERMKKYNIVYGRTYFVGFSLTGFHKSVFEKVSYGTYDGGTFDGWGSDYFISRQLNSLNIPMYFNVNFYVEHLACYRNFLFDKVEPHVEIVKRKV